MTDDQYDGEVISVPAEHRTVTVDEETRELAIPSK